MTKSKNKVRFASYFVLIFISYTLSITLKFFTIVLFLTKFLHKILTRHEVLYRHIITNSNKKIKLTVFSILISTFYALYITLKILHNFFSTLNDKKF